MNKKRSWWYGLLAVYVLAYLFVTVGLAADSATMSHYKISDEQLKLLSLTLVLPIILIWFAGFYGFVNLKRYASRLTSGADASGFKYLAYGVGAIVVPMPFTNILSRVFQYTVSQNHFPQATATIITNYLSLVFPLIGFSFLLFGANKLVSTLKKVQIPNWQYLVVSLLLAVISLTYVLATLSNPSREVAVGSALKATYALNDALIVATLVLPYILMWAFGFYTVLLLRAYYRNVGGKWYKAALNRLTFGLLFVILLSIVVQFLTAALTVISGWSLGAFLILLYLLIISIGVGYVFIAMGAKDLSKLEEVT